MEKVTLQTPVLRKGSDPITEVTLRKPCVGDLRGCGSMIELVKMDVRAVEKVLPRITSPSLLPEEIAVMDIADIFALAGVLSGFFATQADKEAFGMTP